MSLPAPLGRILIALLNIPVLGWLSRFILGRIFCYPRLDSFSARRTRVVVTQDNAGGCELSFGAFNQGQPGIVFDATVVVPRRCTGRLEFVQDVITHSTREPAANRIDPKECLSSSGRRLLDTSDPYHDSRVGPGIQRISTEDSPANSLSFPIPFEVTNVSDQFRMFLMWRPDRFGRRIRLPIAVIEWWWEGMAIGAPFIPNANPPPDCVSANDMWRLTSSPNDHGHTPARTTSQVPVLAPNVTGLTWVRC